MTAEKELTPESGWAKLPIVLAARKSFLLRIDPQILEAVGRWADDDLDSVNGHIEFLLRRALSEAGRDPKTKPGIRKTKTNKAKRPSE